MPLHLLGKKSWNVYNQDNISRVRKDEADAQARDEAAEQRMQEEDASRRIAILRGESVAPLQAPDRDKEEPADPRKSGRDEEETYATRDRKRKRRNGEDDTDRDIRYARQDREAGTKARETLLGVEKIKKGSNFEAPLQDHAGHIQLFAAPDEKGNQKNAEAEAEKAKKRKREEDLIMMKFSNAAGYSNGMQKPWYAAAVATQPVESKIRSRSEMMLSELQGKDVWGNEDPKRKERETKKIVSSDPFAAMQHAQRQLKQSEKDKEEWQRRQKSEIEALKMEQARNDADEVDSLDGFSLDAPATERHGGEKRRKHHHHHSRRHHSGERWRESRHRHRSRSRERDRVRHRSRSRERDGRSSHRSRHRERRESDR